MPDAKLCRRGSGKPFNAASARRLFWRIGTGATKPGKEVTEERASIRAMTRRNDLYGLQDCIRVETETLEVIAEKGNKFYLQDFGWID